MHIPDGFLATPVWLGLDAIALPAVGAFARRAQREIEEARAPLLGVMGAFVFAAQMVNFPVGIGTSGHLVGGALLAVTLGPAAACVVMTAILAIQGFVFQDGGILALGANVFNMALAGVLAGWLPYRLWGAGRGRRAAVFLGAFLSVLVSALLALAELLASGIRMPAPVVGVSLGLFLISAAIEGTITLAVVEGIERLSPRAVRAASPSGSPVLVALGIAAVLLACGGILFASAAPDGLESLADRIGISRLATSLFTTPLADYSTRWLGASWTSRSAAGLAGLGLIGALCAALGWMAGRKRSV
ncbi:MAG TPA: energy-coupling factor ABC transporter permease [Bryobacteraceae bacterium]|nr:energy-coupling factor ABC transporter permease [Bryobacteraceae bacterium]